MASDVIKGAVPKRGETRSKKDLVVVFLWCFCGVSKVGSHGQQAFGARGVSGAGTTRTARATYPEWAE